MHTVLAQDTGHMTQHTTEDTTHRTDDTAHMTQDTGHIMPSGITPLSTQITKHTFARCRVPEGLTM